MRSSLRGYGTLTWEYLAPERTVSSVGNKRTFRAHLVKWLRIYDDKLTWVRLCVVRTDDLAAVFRLRILWSGVRSQVEEISACTADETK